MSCVGILPVFSAVLYIIISQCRWQVDQTGHLYLIPKTCDVIYIHVYAKMCHVYNDMSFNCWNLTIKG